MQRVVLEPDAVGFPATSEANPHAIRLLRQTADLQLATHNVFVGGNSTKFTDWATEAWGVHAVWLPNLYSLAETFPQHQLRWQGGALRLGLFGANRPLKNFLSGAAAAVELARRLRVPVELLLSSGRNERGNFRALDEMTENIPNLRIVHTGWLAWPAFRRLLRTIDLVFQVSYTETFNVVTADAIAEGVRSSRATRSTGCPDLGRRALMSRWTSPGSRSGCSEIRTRRGTDARRSRRTSTGGSSRGGVSCARSSR